MSWGETDLD
uniref:Uncharacterized protein n=1 Tax=Arundo donax TaxID=35708 RepID=A0A0A8Z3C3_ARUDO